MASNHHSLTGDKQKLHIHQALKFLHPGKGAVFEICALGPRVPKSGHWQGYAGGKKAVVAGWYDDLVKATEAAAALDTIGCEGIYVTLNGVDSALLGRANNRLQAGVARTRDKEVPILRRFPIDIDPKRPAGISSTDENHQAALDHAIWLRNLLSSKGWPDPLYGDSGNGAHLIYQLPDLANTEENVNLIRDTLKALNDLYRVAVPGSQGDINLDIDCTVFNSARIIKLYGTHARKGDHTKERPHRQAQIIDLPKEPLPVSIELLNALIESARKDDPQEKPGPNTNQGHSGGKLNVPGYLQHYEVEVKSIKNHKGSTLYVLPTCLFDDSHTRGEAAIGQTAEGKTFYQCFHDSCKKTRTWTDARQKISGSDHLGQFAEGYTQSGVHSRNHIEAEAENEVAWELARGLFPRIPFPWHVLPSGIADSLQQLARSCASSSDHLPGVALAILASSLGRALAVSPKASWCEPLALWVGDIRASGEGKTPTGRLLLKSIEKAQFTEHQRFKDEMEDYQKRLDQWDALPKKERVDAFKPRPSRKERGYMITDLTLEGLREDLDEHPTGGIVVCQDELSSFVSSQNQYRTKGNDRESWLCLHDGNPARVRRAGKVVWIHGGRVSLFGGIQPGVFQRAFTSDDGVFLEDGTLFRFLLTYEQAAHHTLTKESWTEGNRGNWESLLGRALDWAGAQANPETGCIKEPICMFLDADAQNRFFDWRNSLDQQKRNLHPILRGFLPKACGYALRLSGLIHSLWRFHSGDIPNRILSLEDIERGIDAVEFYLGQTVDAMRLIEEPEHCPTDTSERVKHLAETLEALRSEVDSGRLAVGFIQERFNQGMPKEKQIGTAKAMGALLRSIPLTIPDRLHDFHGQRRVSCLEWDNITESFIKRSLHSLHSLQRQEQQCFADGDIGNSKSPKSPQMCDPDYDLETLERSENQSLRPENAVNSAFGDVGDVGDFIADKYQNLDSEERGNEFDEGTL
ncbi:MAG: DUF3987 domain-containing protein [Syntrophobacteraceae bacterium]